MSEMVISLPTRSYSPITVDFKEYKRLTIETISRNLISCLNEHDIYYDEEEVNNALSEDIKIWEKSRFLKKKENSKPTVIQFEYVGLLLPREVNKKIRQQHHESPPKDILFFIYPKWSDIIAENDNLLQMRTVTMKSIIAYIRNLKKKEGQGYLRSRYSANQNDPSLMLEALYAVVEFTNRKGILTEQEIKRTKRSGEEDWVSTFSHGIPMYSMGKPYYTVPIRKRKNNIFTELSKIHQEIYNYCMTYLTRFFPMRTKIKFKSRVEFSVKELRTMKKIISMVLLRTRIHKNKQSIRVLKNFIDDYPGIRHHKTINFGLTSKSFDLLWENALLETFGDSALTNRINELFVTQRMMRDTIRDKESKHLKIDGASVIGDRIILYDSKNYADWSTIGTEDLHKQYLYEYGINYFIQEGFLVASHVQKNAFIFPKKQSNILADNSDFSIIGSYSQPFLTDLSNRSENRPFGPRVEPNTRDWGEGILAIEVQGFFLLRKYIERTGRVENEFLDVFGLNI